MFAGARVAIAGDGAAGAGAGAGGRGAGRDVASTDEPSAVSIHRTLIWFGCKISPRACKPAAKAFVPSSRMTKLPLAEIF